MPTWNVPALLFAMALSMGMAVVGGLLVFVYLVWVFGYDIPWAYRLWRLNPPLAHPAN